MVREGSVSSPPESTVCRMPIGQHKSAALAPVRKEGGVSLGGWVWAQGLFFTEGGGRDHIKFFITDLQKMSYMYYSHLSGFFSFFVFSQNSGRKEKCRRQVSQAPGLRSEGSRASSPRGSRWRWGEDSFPSSAAAPFLGWPPWRAAGQKHLRLLCLEAWSSKHRPTGARQREVEGGTSTEGQ